MPICHWHLQFLGGDFKMEDTCYADAKTITSKGTHNYYSLSDDYGFLPQSLQSILQKKQELKQEYQRAMEEQILLSELEKQPKDWLTTQQADKEMSDSQDIYKEITSILNSRTEKIQETVDIAADALETLKEKLSDLSQKVGKLEEKYSQLNASDSSAPSIDSLQCHHSDIKNTIRKVAVLLTAARAERDIVRKRVNRMEETLQSFESLSSSIQQKDTDSEKKLKSLQRKLSDFQRLSGMKCHQKSDKVLEVEFPPAPILDDSSTSGGSNSSLYDARLLVTLTFSEDQQQCLELADVQLNHTLKGTEEIIRTAKVDKDLPKLINELNKKWMYHVPLISEIAYLRERHAVDWVEEKSVLLLMIRKSNSVVCSLQIPSDYPYSGQIVLDNVMGQTVDMPLENIIAPADTSLKGWVLHLENLFGQTQV